MTDTLPITRTPLPAQEPLIAESPVPVHARLRLDFKKNLISVAKWTGVIIVVYLLAEIGEMAGLPATQMLFATVIGLAIALSGRKFLTFPKQAQLGTQALIGVVMGGYMQFGQLKTLGPVLAPIVLLTMTTLLLSILAGWALACFSSMTRGTATLGMMAGGSAAVISAAEDLDADSRVVAFMQYFRVVLVVVTTPFLVSWVFGAVPAADARKLTWGSNLFNQYRCQGHDAVQYLCLLTGRGDWLAGICIAIVLCVVGIKFGRLVRLPSPALLGPMIVTAVVSSTGISHGYVPDGLLKELLFILVGLDVGLRFTKESLRQVWRLIPAILVAAVTLSAATALLSSFAAQLLHVPLTDMYLATTPGGINAVVATASSVKSNMPLVASAQSLRLLMLVIVLPILSRSLAKALPPP